MQHGALLSLDENALMMGDEPAPRPIRHPVLFIHTPHPSMRQETTLEPDVPRLAVIREAPDDDAARWCYCTRESSKLG